MKKKFVVCLALIISCAVILTAVPLSSSKNEKSEVSYSIVRKRIGDTDLEVEFENELNIYRGDNCSFYVNFINHNENLRYAINMDLKGADEALKKSVLKMASVVTVYPNDDAPFIFWIEPTQTGEYELSLDISTSYFGSLPFVEDLIYALPTLAGALPPILHGLPAMIPFGLDLFILYLPKVLPWVITDLLDLLLGIKPLFDDTFPSVWKHFDFVGYLVVKGLLDWIPDMPGDLMYWIEIMPWAIGETTERWMENLPAALGEWWPTAFEVMDKEYGNYSKKIKQLQPVVKDMFLSYGYYIPEDAAGVLESFATSEYWNGPKWLKDFMQECADHLWRIAGKMHGEPPEKLSGTTSYVIKVKVIEKPFSVKITEGLERWISGFTSFFSYKW